MLTAADKAQMRADVAEVVADDAILVMIRRGNGTLAAQMVRIVRVPRAAKPGSSQVVDEVRGSHLIVGAVGLDIAPGDRLNDGDGNLFRVVLVRPNRMVATEAEAELVA